MPTLSANVKPATQERYSKLYYQEKSRNPKLTGETFINRLLDLYEQAGGAA